MPFGEIHIKLEISWGLIQIRLGQNDLASQSLRKSIADIEKLPETGALEQAKANAYHWFAISLSHLSRFSEAAAAYQQSIEIAKAIGDEWLAVGTLIDLADDYADQNRLEEGEALVLRALEISRQIGDLDNEAYARSTKAYLLLARGEHQQAASELVQAITISERIGALWNIPIMQADLASAYLATHEIERAHQHATQSLTEAKNNPSQLFDLGYAHHVLARVEAAQRNWESATKRFNQAIIMYEQEGNQLSVAQAQRHLAEALLQQGKQTEAAELLQTALATFRKLALAHEIIETERLLEKNRPKEK